MSETSAIPGPPCDICGEYHAVMSLMNYADYGQMKICSNCAPHFLRTVADSIDGRTTADTPGEAELGTPGPDDDSRSAGVAATPAEMDDDGEPGSAKDHWASTTHVRRSTHGHRSPRGTSGKPREETPE